MDTYWCSQPACPTWCPLLSILRSGKSSSIPLLQLWRHIRVFNLTKWWRFLLSHLGPKDTPGKHFAPGTDGLKGRETTRDSRWALKPRKKHKKEVQSPQDLFSWGLASNGREWLRWTETVIFLPLERDKISQAFYITSAVLGCVWNRLLFVTNGYLSRALSRWVSVYC